MGDIKLRVEKAVKGKPRGRPFSKDNPPPKPFVKGQSGNPSGKPKGGGSNKISMAYSAALNQPVPLDVRERLGIDPEAPCSWADLIAIQMCRKAVETDNAKINFSAVTELRETTEGKTPDEHKFAGADGLPLAAPTFAVNFIKPPDHDADQDKPNVSVDDVEPDVLSQGVV